MDNPNNLNNPNIEQGSVVVELDQVSLRYQA